MLVVWLPTAALAQVPVPAPAATVPAPEAPADSNLPLVAGLGAIAGVVGFNLVALGLQALPGGLAYGSGSVVAAEMSVAMSRVYATVSAVAGGLLGHHLYENWTAEDPAAAATASTYWPVDPGLIAAGVGAVAGALAFNILAAPIATVPLAGGALAAVPVETALGSRLIAGLSTAAGAIGATALYDWTTGHVSDYGHAAMLAAGAMGGIAVGNLIGGTIGTPPFYAGAGEAASLAAGMASATAQAASRVYVVGFAVLGAWAGDWMWRAQNLPPIPSGPL